MTPDPKLVEDLRLLEAPSHLWLWIVLIILALAAAAAAFLWKRRKRMQLTEVPLESRVVFGREEAMAELSKLEPLLTEETSRQYGIEATAIIRRYIESQFRIHAPRLATEEFLLAAARNPALGVRHRTLLADFLGCCDLFKFASTRGEAPELQTLHTAAMVFVKESESKQEPATV